MRRKGTTAILALVLAFSLLFPLAAMPAAAASTAELPEYIPVDLSSGLGGDVYMPEAPDTAYAPQSYETIDAAGAVPVGTVVIDYYAGYMTLRAINDYAEIWVANDLSFPDGDPRNDDPYHLMITDEMCDYLADQVASVIWPRTTEFFGVPPDRDGTNTAFEGASFPEEYYNWVPAEDNPQRIMVKVLNIVDDGYYDPTYPYYVIGFYSSTYTGWWNRNLIHIDAWNWWERVGAEGTQWFPVDAPELVVPAKYQFAIEGTIAHEYQHLIHHDYNPGDDLFMNEGCSMFAEVLCDYGIPWGHITRFLYTPDNSLTQWEDQTGYNVLADYGGAALWTIYLADHFGPELLSYFVKTGVGGIEGLNAALAHFGYSDTFDEIFHDWTIANLIHSDSPGHGRYNYKTLDLGEAMYDGEPQSVRVYEFDGLPHGWITGSDFGTTYSYDGDDTGIAGIAPYGTDYIGFDNVKKMRTKLFYFMGDMVAEIGWSMREDINSWYSGRGDLVNYLLYGNAYVDPADPTLTITTYWDIEDYWDFGFTQVSTDGGETWTSLGNEYTTYVHDPNAHPDIIANLPGLTSWSGFIDPDNELAMYTMSFDLTDYAGQDVMIGFRYMTDWSFTYQGWFIQDSVTVSGAYVELTPLYPEWNWQVTIVTAQYKSHGRVKYNIQNIFMCDYFDVGMGWLTRSNYDYIYLVISPLGTAGFADYSFKAKIFPSRCR